MNDKVNYYRYIATLEQDDDGVTVEFPDLPGAITCGKDLDEAAEMAKDCLALHLYGMEEDGDPIPAPSSLLDIVRHTQGSGKIPVLVEVFMPLYRKSIAERSVKKTLTVPKWLDDLAAKNNVNYSRILQDALKEQLGVTKRI